MQEAFAPVVPGIPREPTKEQSLPSDRQQRVFGRRYLINWDEIARCYAVTLGALHIGTHKSHVGATRIATRHSQRVAFDSEGSQRHHSITSTAS